MLCLARALLRQSATDNCGRDILVDSDAHCWPLSSTDIRNIHGWQQMANRAE